MSTLEAVRAEADADLYPRDILIGCESALVVFASAFMGRQDAIWMADAGLTATCVDHDPVTLRRMQALYPAGWEFVEADAYRFAEETGGQWDVVSVDSPTGEAFVRCAGLLPTWCDLARRAVVLGCGKEGHALEAPGGWTMTRFMRRSSFEGGVYWAVFERAA